MSAFYPLHLTADWTVDLIFEAVAGLAARLGFSLAGSTNELHEDDAYRIVNERIRNHGITRSGVIERLKQQQSLLLEQYHRTEHRWLSESGEIVLVLAKDNVIPFGDEDIANTARFRFACGWVEFVMPDREIERLKIGHLVHNLPLWHTVDRSA